MKKRMNILCLLLACLLSCSQDKSALDPAYNITLDPGNTYVAGEPVKFNIKGNIDNILFYSGEEGSDYMAGDKGIVIKNIQNYLHSYEYTWNTYGTYKAVFAGTELIGGKVEEHILEFTINVMPGAEADKSDPEIPELPELEEEYDVFLLIGQ